MRGRRTFYIVRINCDCGSDIVARTSVKWYLGPRCQSCQRPVGSMEYDVVARVRAAGAIEALQTYEASRS